MFEHIGVQCLIVGLCQGWIFARLYCLRRENQELRLTMNRYNKEES